MSDTEDDNFDEAFKGFGEDPAPVTPPKVDEPATPPAVPPATPPVELPKEEPKPAEEPKKDEEPAKTSEEKPSVPATDDKKPEEGAKSAEAPETPPAPEEPETPQPLTKDDVKSVVSNLLNDERSSSKELETTTQEVMEAYYPDGLSNVLEDAKTGKKLLTPADVVEASDNTMSTEEAAQWLMNEQFKLDKSVSDIKDQAKKIAETTLNFKRDAISAVQKYEPLFKAYPTLQNKVYDKLMKQVKVDEKKNVILSAPDVMEHYDDYLEPYQQAFEVANKKPATNPTPPATPDPPKPKAEDRMDEGGDGGVTVPDDPNDFAQQVKKELS